VTNLEASAVVQENRGPSKRHLASTGSRLNGQPYIEFTNHTDNTVELYLTRKDVHLKSVEEGDGSSDGRLQLSFHPCEHPPTMILVPPDGCAVMDLGRCSIGRLTAVSSDPPIIYFRDLIVKSGHRYTMEKDHPYVPVERELTAF
jgi:hypothetical protein